MRNKHRWVASHTPPTGELAHNPGMCPDQELNQRPFNLQAGTQSTEPHQPELDGLYQLCSIPVIKKKNASNK